MEKENIYHGNITLENLLFDDEYNIKIADKEEKDFTKACLAIEKINQLQTKDEETEIDIQSKNEQSN